jgi:putative ABC transport system permease protein
MPRSIRFFLDRLVRPHKLDDEMSEELQFHLSSRAEQLQQSGLSAEEALRVARLEFGSMEKYREQGGRARDFQALHVLHADIRYGVRMMRKSPGFTAAAVLTLALGIGANSAMFGIVYGLLFRPLPYPDANGIAMVHMNFSPQNAARGTLSVADFVDWKDGNTVFERVAAYGESRFALTGENQAEEVTGASVTADFFAILGVNPILGRTFETGDDSPSEPNLVVIKASLWQRRYQGSPAAIGRVIEVNGNPATIIGVVKNGSEFPRGQTELWQNLHLKVTRRGPFCFRGIGRLRPGVTLRLAQAETNLIGRNIERANPGAYANLNMPVESLRSFLVGDIRTPLLMMFAAVLAVLLIATLNIANLLLARATTREREMAIRLSLGAARRRLVQQLLTESVLLSLTGAAAGLSLAFTGIRMFRTFNPAGFPLAFQVQLDWSVLLFTLGISVTAGVVFGLVPARQSSGVDLHGPLKESGRSGSRGAGQHRTRAALVITEIALSLVLLVAAGLLVHSFVLLQRVDVGTSAPPSNVLTMIITPKTLRKAGIQFAYDNGIIRFYQRLIENISRLPGVQYAAISDSLPPDQEGEDDTFSIAGQSWSDQAFPSTSLPKVSPDYFRILGVPLLRGRFFTENDTANSPPVTIISEALARRYFPNIDPIGQKIRASAPTNTDPYMDVVGVVGDLKYWGLQSEFKPAYYQPYTQNFNTTIFLLVRSSKPAAGLATTIEREVHSMDKDAVVRRVLTMEDLLDESVAKPRFNTLLLTGFGVLALMLAGVGIYGVIAYSVTLRTQEIGIRIALGAQRSDVLKMVMLNGALLTAVGIGIGLLGSLVAAHAISGFLFETRPDDPLALTAGCALLSVVALAATFVPALSATRIDPQVALRHE